MIKAAAGGGGIGMSAAANETELRAGFETARSRAERFFGSAAILLERYISRARHVEVQILGLNDSRVVALGERDCSVQRRHQKVAEETPSPGVGPQLRARMLAAAVQAGEAVGYRNAGTVECLVDSDAQDFVFLEMNTRLQVEHPVTEMVTGIDLVEQQFLIAAGHDISFDPAAVQPSGHALELRVYAEDPERFLPSPGLITEWAEPSGPGIRVDAGYGRGQPGDAVLRPAAGQAVRARRLPRPGAGPGPRRGSLVQDRRAPDEPGLSRRTAGQRRVRQRALRYFGGRAAAMMCMMAAQPWSRLPGDDEEVRVTEVRAEMVANVWKVVAAEGGAVADGDTLVILESMKMEIPVLAESSGTVTKLAVAEGDVVQEGDLIAVIE